MKQKKISYRSTVMACYIGNFTQAVVINLTPVLFIPLREQFGLSFSQLGLLVLINFITQVGVDLLFSGVVDRYGFRPFIVGAHVLTVVGLALFALTPSLPIDPYLGFVIATFIFAGAGGLLELLLSPIINAIPSDEKAAAMSVMHSFYCWGQVAVVLVTTFFLHLFGRTSWPVIALIWAVVPLFNVFLFSRVPLADVVPEDERHSVKDILFNSLFIACLLSILFGGAAELSISQWTSTFMEAAMGVKKVVGDTLGMSAFAVMMGIGRLYYGTNGKKINLHSMMLAGATLSFVCYLTVAFSPYPAVSMLACALCGLGVSLMWPGSLSLAAAKFPLAGAWMFAIMAAAGDIGASVGPWLVGFVSDNMVRFAGVAQIAEQLGLNQEQAGLRIGVLVASVFPLGSILTLLWIKKREVHLSVRANSKSIN